MKAARVTNQPVPTGASGLFCGSAEKSPINVLAGSSPVVAALVFGRLLESEEFDFTLFPLSSYILINSTSSSSTILFLQANRKKETTPTVAMEVRGFNPSVSVVVVI